MSLAAGLLACAAVLVGGMAAARPAWAAPVDRPYPDAAPCNTSLQACIDGAQASDTLVVSAGTSITSLPLNKAVSLTGVSSATVILRALPNTRVLSVTGAAISNTVVTSGLTFTGGHVTSGGPGRQLGHDGGHDRSGQRERHVGLQRGVGQWPGCEGRRRQRSYPSHGVWRRGLTASARRLSER